jgi:hypothetical protein
MRNYFVVAIVAICGTGLMAQTATKFLDLTRPDEMAKMADVSSISVLGGGAATNESHKIPLRLSLVEFDGDYYGQADPFVVTVMLENVGQTSVTIPWSGATSDLRNRPLEKTMRASLGLQLRDSQGQLRLGSGIVLMGAPEVAGSMLALKPGEKAMVKAPSQWVLDNATVAWLAGGVRSAVEVTATLNVSEGGMTTYNTIHSTGHLIVSFHGPQR